MPFCIASCRTNSLVAIGTEPGIIFIIDSAKGAKFKKTHLKCSQHKNALMDLEFSSDDSTLATAAGDQTARLVDMPTQKTKAVLENRHGSLKQVRFQPGDDSVIATSSREGSVNIWDIRCSASDRPVLDISIAGDPQDQVVADATPSTHNAKYYDVPTCTIEMAHAKRRGTVEEPANSRFALPAEARRF
jgi:WD40 repeat protein